LWVGLAVSSDQNISVGSIRNGTYRDAVTGNELPIGGGTISFQVRANSAGTYARAGSARRVPIYVRSLNAGELRQKKNYESRESARTASYTPSKTTV